MSAELPKKQITSYTYDTNGNVLTIKDPENNTTTFTYCPVRMSGRGFHEKRGGFFQRFP